ncbi:MAG: hypothetical protein BroJett021_03890 [Chloroflexota bacterium]|nr:MAG: hypothetical protein BroJett021_03890 [Chloroflexota bacterium]
MIGLLLALLFVLAAPAPGHALAADSQRAERNRQIDIVQEQGVPLFLPLIIASEEQVVIENLLPNGDFEDGALAGWEASAGAVAATDHAHGGNYAACLTNDASLRSQWIVVQPGRTYKLTAWVKIVEERITGDDLWGGFSLSVSDDEWQTLAQSDALVEERYGNQWFKLAISFTALRATALVDIGYFGGDGRRMTACVDDIMLFRKGDNRPPRFTASLTPTTLTTLPAMQRFALSGDDPDGAIERVLWDFGDGGRALTWQGERRIALPGVYTATIHVADDEGAVTTQAVTWTAVDSTWPTVQIVSPTVDVREVAAPMLRLSGVTSGDVTEVVVSTDREVVEVAQGATSWRADAPLRPGVNRILVQARDRNGRIATVERSVRYTPAGALSIRDLAFPAAIEQWEPLEITFDLANSAATHPHFPFDVAPPGLAWIDGVTVEASFTPDDWVTVYTRPAFLQQPYTRSLKQGREWLYPLGEPQWTVRFAPPAQGTWQVRIAAQEAKGVVESAVYTFTVNAPTNPLNHGPVRVAERDSRYFEFADGTPFLGLGHGAGFNAEQFSYAASALFDEVGEGNQDFFRWWISGAIWGSAWQPWRSRTLSSDGYIPATGLTLARAYGDGLAALRLDADNPIMFYGFDSGMPGLIPGRTYRLAVRWRTEGIDAALNPAQPFGVVVKFTDWPEAGDTPRFPALIAHVHGDTPWHVATAEFVADDDFPRQFLTLVLENARDGVAYIDAVTLHEVRSDGAPGAQLLRNPQMNSHLTFDDRRAAGIDAILAEANHRGFYFKLVISEKNEWLLNRLGPEGLPEPLGGNFNAEEGSAGRWLHEAYWRYLSARYGAFRSVHSWELVNEEAPGFGAHFRLAAALAERSAADGNPHLVSTSTWATLAEDAWKHPESAAISYVDFHAYVNNTGWLGPKDELTVDSARLFAEYDRAVRQAAFGKPVVWGELGIDGAQTSDEEDLQLAEDRDGVWLHKLTWARLGPGGVYPLYWYTDNIFDHALHPIFGAWRRFMAGIPLTNGRYVDAEATSTIDTLRVFGQKDVAGGRAHLWIDNARHTWLNVVTSAAIPTASGAVAVKMDVANAAYRVTWHDTRTGQLLMTQTVTADAAGVVRLTVNELATDRAVKLERIAARR